MRARIRVATICAALLGAATVTHAQTVLTLPEVLALARERAPRIINARLAIDETRARLIGATRRVQSNPEVSAGLGNRREAEGPSTDIEIGLSQQFEPGARRSARIAGADAAIAATTAEADEVTRLALRASATAYYHVLHADARLGLLASAQELASGVYAVADRRFEAGDIAVLDVNIARASLARVRAERRAAEAERAAAIGALKHLLALEGGVSVQGSLVTPEPVDLTARLASAASRPELRALEARVHETDADVQLASSYTRPEYGWRVGYQREEGDQIVLGGVIVTLPFFARGQELRAAGSARATRLRRDLDAAHVQVRIEVQAAFDAYQQRLEAVQVLATEALPGLDENEALTTRSFEVGQLGLPDLLLLRREMLDTRFQYLDALFQAALARIDLDASAAVLR